MEDFDAIYEHIKDYNLTISLADEERGLYAVELTLKNHNKSIAAKKVLDYYGLGYEDAIAIGDSDNDNKHRPPQFDRSHESGNNDSLLRPSTRSLQNHDLLFQPQVRVSSPA